MTQQGPGALLRTHRAADIAFILSAQLSLFDAEYGLSSPVWNSYLRDGVQRFADAFDPSLDRLTILEQDSVPLGSIAIVHSGEAKQAQLRFFFLDPAARGRGLGQRLMEDALNFCGRAGYRCVFLWTFSTLYAARHLYEKAGFRLAESVENNEWGTPILEERWDLSLPA